MLIVGETYAARMTAFVIAADGGLSNRRVYAALPAGSVPDGCRLDAEGAVWDLDDTRRGPRDRFSVELLLDR